MCRICALAIEHVLSPSLGIRWCEKKQYMGKSLGLILLLICPLSFQLSLDCEVGACIQVPVCSSFWKSYTTSVTKQHFYFGHQKTLHGSELCITMCCVERMWRGLHFLWVLLGPSVEKQKLTQVFLTLVWDYWLWRAFQVKSTSFMVPSASLNCPEILDISIILVSVQYNLPLLRV